MGKAVGDALVGQGLGQGVAHAEGLEGAGGLVGIGALVTRARAGTAGRLAGNETFDGHGFSLVERRGPGAAKEKGVWAPTTTVLCGRTPGYQPERPGGRTLGACAKVRGDASGTGARRSRSTGSPAPAGEHGPHGTDRRRPWPSWSRAPRRPSSPFPTRTRRRSRSGTSPAASVIVYFYPADDTPGCTKEACQFNDNLRAFSRAGAKVVGISPDGAAKHTRFRTKYKLKFPLLSDPDHKVMEAYGAWGEKTMYGRKTVGTIRSTFLIDAKGTIARAWYGVRADGHADKVLAELKALGE